MTTAKKCALLSYYATSGGNFLPMFQDNLLVPSSGVKIPNHAWQPQCDSITHSLIHGYFV